MAKAYQCDSCDAFQSGPPPFQLWVGESQEYVEGGYKMNPEEAREMDLCSRCYHVLCQKLEDGFEE